MTEQIESGDIIYFVYTGSRYEAKLTSGGVWLRPMDGNFGEGYGMGGVVFERMLRDGLIKKEESDD